MRGNTKEHHQRIDILGIHAGTSPVIGLLCGGILRLSNTPTSDVFAGAVPYLARVTKAWVFEE